MDETTRFSVMVYGSTYRNYIKELGMRWNPVERMWLGRLTSGKAWFLRTKLGLDVCEDGQRKPAVSESLRQLVEKTCHAPVRLEKTVRREVCCDREDRQAAWEHYSAEPIATSWDARIRPEKNVNERGCHWGCEFCQGCMECISNVDENDVLPHPELDFWDREEERVRENATLPVGT